MIQQGLIISMQAGQVVFKKGDVAVGSESVPASLIQLQSVNKHAVAPDMDRAGVACSMVIGVACFYQLKGLATECRAFNIGARSKGVAFHCRCQDRPQVVGGCLISVEFAVEVAGHVQDLFAHGVFLISYQTSSTAHWVQANASEL
jgi:hypothetical protein